jgi:hypothetical protein
MTETQLKKATADSEKKPEGKGKGRQQSRFRRQGFEQKKRDPDAVPTLKYGPGNNFMCFKEALSKKVLEEYGALGKLIKQGKIEEPEEADKTFVDLTDEFEKLEYIEDMKPYRKLKWELDQKKPKLYATILKYLSDESLEAIQKTKDWTDIEEKVDPERLC